MNDLPITPAQNRKLHALLSKTGKIKFKAELVLSHTDGRTDTSSEMLSYEADNLCHYLNKQLAATEPDAVDRQRKKILAICHTLQWYKRDASGALITKDGRPVLDFDRINTFCTTKTKYKKPLQAHTAQELPQLVTVFEKLTKGV